MSATLARASARSLRSAGLLRITGQPNGRLPSLLSRFYASKSFPPHTVINMPALSPTMTQGNIGTWQKKAGDTLAPGDVLVEIETDKAQMDFEFQEDGVLAKVLKDSGEKDIPVGTPIAVFLEEGDDVAAFADFTAADAGGDAKPAPQPEKEQSSSSAPPKESAPTPAPSAPEQTLSTGGPLETSLQRLEKGTAKGGKAAKSDSAAPAAVAAAAVTDIPLTSMRKTIAKRLQESMNTSPHYYVQSSLSVSKLLKLRQALNASANGEYKLSVNDFLIKAVASALLKVPQVNSSFREAEGIIKQYSTADISVAVATPVGLMTPIVASAHAKGLRSISNEVKELAAKARDGKLKPEQYQGGTFTISNMGMNNAIDRFTAVINPPQAGILAVGAVKKVAVEGKNGGIEWDEQLVVSGSFDHRVVDGAVGGDFMKALKKVIENPLELML